MSNALIFHSFNNDINADPFYDLNLNDFKKILRFLKKQKNGKKVIITFDDGYKSIIPAVEFSLKNKFETIIFVVTDLLGNEGFLTDNDLLFLSSRGCIIGSHSKSHANLANLKNHFLRDELSQSKLILEKIINKKVEIFSFPYGQKNKRSIKEALLHYKFIAISRPLLCRSKYLIGRISINKLNFSNYQNLFYLSQDNLKIIFFFKLLGLKFIKSIIPNKYYLILKKTITGNISKDVFNSN